MAKSVGGDGGRLKVPGLYVALRAREREHRRSGDEFAAAMVDRYGFRPSWRLAPSLLDDLDAARPVVLQGRRLKGHGLPRVPLRREQAFDWFAVSPDDTVVPAESPE